MHAYQFRSVDTEFEKVLISRNELRLRDRDVIFEKTNTI